MKIRIIFFIIPFFIFSSCKDKEKKAPLPQKIKVVKVIQEDTPIYKEFIGQIFGLKDIPIRARVEGFLEEIHFDEGMPVKKGQLLYTIDPAPFTEAVVAKQSMVSQARTLLVQSESDLKRIKPLAAMDAVSQRELDMAQAKRDASISTLEASKADLKVALINLSYTKIHSPIKGVIGATQAREGEFVGKNPNPVILNTVSRIDTVRVQFFLAEADYLGLVKEYFGNKDINKIKKEELDKANRTYNLELILSDGSVFSQKGQVDFVNRNVDPTTGSILIQAHFPNPNRLLRPGLYAKVKAEMYVVKGALLVPQKCVSELQGQYSVFVLKSDDTVEARQIKVGERIGDLWLITDGLKPGETIALEGLQSIRTGTKINPTVVEIDSQIKKQ